MAPPAMREGKAADRRLLWLGVPLALLLFRGALLGEQALLGADLFLFNLPQLEVLERAYRAGHVPGWSPALGLGQPLLGNPCIAAHYPGHLLVLLARPVVALTWLLALHVVLAHAGAYRLARSFGCSPAAAALAGLAFAGGGVMQSYVHVPSMLLGGAWMPWAVLATVRAVEPGAPARRVVVAAAVFAMTYLCGVPEVAALSGVLAWGAAAASPAGVVRATVGLVVVAALALAMSASALLPFVLSFRDTNRAGGFDYGMAGTWSLHPLELLGLVVPRPFGPSAIPATLLGHEQRTWNQGLHLGAAGAAFALVGLASARTDRRARLLACMAAPLLIYAFGRWGGLHWLLYQVVEPIRSFRYPAKAFLAVTLCLALLGAIGLDHARRTARARAFVPIAAANALALLGALGAGDMLPLAQRAAIAAAAAALAGWAAVRGRWSLLLVLTLAELALLSTWVFDRVPAAMYESPPALLRAGVAAGADRPGGAPPRVSTTHRAGDVVGVVVPPGLARGLAQQRSWREALVPNSSLGAGVRSVFGFSSFKPARAEALTEALAATSLPRFHRLLGASHLVHTGDERLPPDEVAPVTSLGPWVVGRLVDVPPWAAVYARPLRARDLADAARQVADEDFDPRFACVVEGLAPPVDDADDAGDSGASEDPPARVGEARVVALDDERIALEVAASADGVLVVREGWGTGWSATVDGRPAPVLPADAVFRAVPVPAGRHEVVLEYEAPGRRLGALVGGLGLLALLGAALLEARAARRR